MRVINKQVVLLRIEILGFDKTDWKVITKVLPDLPVANPLRPASASVGSAIVVDIPGNIKKRNEEKRAEEQENKQEKTGQTEEEERVDPLGDNQRLDSAFQRDVEEVNKFDPEEGGRHFPWKPWKNKTQTVDNNYCSRF